MSFLIKFDPADGTLLSLKHPEDTDEMNWVEGDAKWGTVKGGETLSAEVTEDSVHAVYKTKHLLVTVDRKIDGDIYRETYRFENTGTKDVFFNRGGVGIYTTFNDNYDLSTVCLKQKCHTHIWCGRNSSYINARKMGLYGQSLALVLTKGSLDTYSVERVIARSSHDRGDFILHPMPFHLRPNESMTVEWEMFWCNDGDFEKAIIPYETVLPVKCEYFTVFTNEKIRFSVPDTTAQVFLDGKQVNSQVSGDETLVEYVPERLGNHDFVIKYGNGKYETVTQFFVQIPFKELARKRAEFIVHNQQFHSEGDSLDGAYMVYDNQDKCVIYDELFADYNACRERLTMGIFIAKYLQYDRDEEIYASLMKYYRFVSREFFDEESGAVYNAVGKDPAFKRLYNAPWMSVFMMELFNLTGDTVYLKRMFKLLQVYYSIGGDKFYPNGLSMYESVDALKRGNMDREAEELTAMYVKHADNIIGIDLSYPGHEVGYEQSIVAPAVTLTAQACLLTGDKKYIEASKKQLMILERFNGHQPSHLLNDLAIRHWDGYWFGKRQLYGDTFPHSASVHTSDAFLHYYWITGDGYWLKRAKCGARNNFSVFRPDGSASCTRLHPLTVNGIRGEYYDEFANEQDGFLYFYIKFFKGLEKNT